MLGLPQVPMRGQRWIAMALMLILLALAAPPSLPAAQATPPTLPPGPSPAVVYAETTANGMTTLWAAPAANPGARWALWTTRTLPGFGVRAALSPDGSRIAVLLLPADAPGDAARFAGADLWLLNDGAMPQRLAQGLNLYTLLWSPDSTRLLVQREIPALPSRMPTPYSTDLIIVHADGSSAHRLLADNMAYGIYPLGWSADGARVLYDRIDLDGVHTLWSVDVHTGMTWTQVVLGRGPMLSLVQSPLGDRLVAQARVASDPALYTLDVIAIGAGERTTLRRDARGATPDDYYVPVWSPDGAALTVGGPSGIEVIHLSSGASRTLIPRDSATPASVAAPLAWSPDEGWLAFERRGLQGNSLFALAPDGQQVRIAAGERSIVTFAGWLLPQGGPGSQLIASPHAPAVCPVQAVWGRQPYPSELGPVFDLAGRNLLGDLGPPLPPVNYGLPPNMTQIAPFVPCVVLKAIGYTESAWKQFVADYGGTGPTLISFDCGYGIMQITSYMSGGGGFDPQRVAAEPAYNIGTGARILIQKWNWVPFIGENDPYVAEEWYYAVWAYNSWGWGNNPNNPRFPANRPPWTGAPGQNRSDYPYQELVWGYAGHPPSGSFWTAVPLTLPPREWITDPPPYWIPRPSPWHSYTCNPLPTRAFLPLVFR